MVDEPGQSEETNPRSPWEGYILSATEQDTALSDIRYIIEYQATDGGMS
jgi:hypothetical protein